MRFSVKIFGCLALLANVSAPSAFAQERQNAAAQADRFASELLQAHNVERSEFGVRPLSWSPQLADEARGWANQLARRGVMQHASLDQRKGRGENLWMGTAGYFSLSAMIGYFAEEKRHFRPGTFPNVSRTGNWADVGHYTQMVWAKTREVGCGIAHGRGNEFLVCRYWPAGNTYGRKVG